MMGRRLRAIALSLSLTVAGAASAAARDFSFDLGGVHINGSINFNGAGLFGEGGILDGRLFDRLPVVGGGLVRGGLVNGAADYLHMRFDDRLDDLMDEYDRGVAEIEDFFMSEEYTDIVSDVNRLADRYDRFIEGVDLGVERFDRLIDLAEQKVDRLDDLVGRLENRLPPRLFERVEGVVGDIQDLALRNIDLLEGRRSELEESLAGYQMFESDLIAYRDEIVAAGGQSPVTEMAAAAAAVVAAKSISPVESQATLAAVPEPGGAAIAAALVGLAGGCGRRWLRRQHVRS